MIDSLPTSRPARQNCSRCGMPPEVAEYRGTRCLLRRCPLGINGSRAPSGYDVVSDPDRLIEGDEDDMRESDRG